MTSIDRVKPCCASTRPLVSSSSTSLTRASSTNRMSGSSTHGSTGGRAHRTSAHVSAFAARIISTRSSPMFARASEIVTSTRSSRPAAQMPPRSASSRRNVDLAAPGGPAREPRLPVQRRGQRRHRLGLHADLHVRVDGDAVALRHDEAPDHAAMASEHGQQLGVRRFITRPSRASRARASAPGRAAAARGRPASRRDGRDDDQAAQRRGRHRDDGVVGLNEQRRPRPEPEMPHRALGLAARRPRAPRPRSPGRRCPFASMYCPASTRPSASTQQRGLTRRSSSTGAKS